jgi:hypothetical protein
MHPSARWNVAYLVLLAVAFVASLSVSVMTMALGDNQELIVSDGKAYYIWVRSLMLDGDVDFEDDYRLVYPPDPLPPESSVRTPRGHPVDKYPVGMAILETPGFLIGHLLGARLIRSARDGVSLPYQFSVAWSLMFLYFASFWLLFRALSNLGIATGWTFFFCGTTLLATNLIHYVMKEPAMAHGAGVALLNVLLFVIAPRDLSRSRPRLARAALAGALVGLSFLVRNTNSLLVPALVAVVCSRAKPTPVEWATAAVCAVLVSALQPLSLWFLWGQLRLSTYFNESFTAGLRGVLSALASARHGLFLYSPWYAVLLALSVYLVVRSRDYRWVGVAAVASFAAACVLNGTWHCWWFGDSFGNRAFIETLVPLSVAAALAVTRTGLGPCWRRAVVVSASIAVVLNVYLWVGYVLHAYPANGLHTAAQAYLWLLKPASGFLLR